jgi:hypothetical protein
MNALDEGQRKKAILNYTVGDLVLGPGHEFVAVTGVTLNTLRLF